MGRWLREPEPDPDIERFRDGVVALFRGGEQTGYVATRLGAFTNGLSRQQQWWVWFVVVFNDGTRHNEIEDYPPWTYVREMLNGYFDWQESSGDEGPFDVVWLEPDEAARVRSELDIDPSDF
ncbi:hypothetical protein [Aeromicrobium sp. CnD17-E]|uniref:hypothetical protein n=1 Tax=Aeromicrobium sp. CnD17-E TaxID=2954487 RepID=UPI002096ECB3|nr:hypothetical protein [Aeromicrobium sp. CnD17-E]MCO7240095.1 hypothetical protein [Aeromicrobium sp. CnD17-E]